MTLDAHLAACQRDTGLIPGVASPSTRALQAAVRDNPGLADEARQRLARDRGLEARDHISRWRNALLLTLFGGGDV